MGTSDKWSPRVLSIRRLGTCGKIRRGRGSKRTEGNLSTTDVSSRSVALECRCGILSRQPLNTSLLGTACTRPQTHGSMCLLSKVCRCCYGDRRIAQLGRRYMSTISVGKPFLCRMVCIFSSSSASTVLRDSLRMTSYPG